MSEDLLREHRIKNEHIQIAREILGKKEIVLNPLQDVFIKEGLLAKDKMIIFAPTASGKTLLVHLKYARNIENGKKRMVYLLPYARIRKELLTKMTKWEKLGITSTDDYATYEEGKAQIFVSTYAFVDSLLLRGKKLSSDFFVFDEIDMVADDLQGTKTEGSISRIIRESQIPSLFVLSATIGSPEIAKKWLGCTIFKSDYRPGSFQKKVQLCPPEKKPFEIIEEVFHSSENKEEPMLVFYYNTTRCRKTAVKLAEYRATRTTNTTNPDILQAIKEIVGGCDITSEIGDQIRCLNYRVAFYHARLQPHCKGVVERLLENHLLDVVFTTPALARGINMPVRTVLIPSPFKFSTSLGNVLISRVEIEQMFGRACRPPFQDKGFGILLSNDPSQAKLLKERIHGDLEKMSSKLLQTSARKGRTLNQYRLAIELIKEAKMRKLCEGDLKQLFGSYLFMQEIKDKEGFYKILESIVSSLIKVGLLDKNVDQEIITPEVVDIVIDYGVDDLDRMLRLINLSKDVVDGKLAIFSGHVLSDILYTLCKGYSSYGIGTVKGIYDSEKIKSYIIERTQSEPPKIDNEHCLFVALDLYSAGNDLETIEKDYGLEPDSIPYIATNVVSHDLVLLTRLVERQCLGDRDKISFCRFMEMCANMIKRGVPYQVLPFVEVIDRLGRKVEMRILEEYGSAVEILKVLKDEKRTSKEFLGIEGIAKTLNQRIIAKRVELIANLQSKITLWGTFSAH